MTVILQLTSFLLVCIGVQIVWNGASALLRTLPAGSLERDCLDFFLMPIPPPAVFCAKESTRC